MSVRGVIVKNRPLNVSLKNCFVVATRNPTKPGAPWELISRSGFVVVCASKLEAQELCFMLGQQNWPPPDPNWSDEQYIAWLTNHYFTIYPHQATDPDIGGKALEIWFHLWLRGWVPDAHDVELALQGPMHPGFANIIQPALDWKWCGK